MNNKYFIKNNPVVRKIFLAMLAPTILMNLTTALASFADAVIIGYFLSDAALSVVTYATPVYMIINTFAALFAVGGSIAMSIDSGKGDKKSSNKAFSLTLELLVSIGVLLLLAGVFFGDTITGWLGAGDPKTDVFSMVKSYSTIVMTGGPIFMLNVGLAFLVRNDGRPTLSMTGMFLSIAVNIIADILFIGVFDMGVSGAAYATVLGQLVSVLVIASHFFSKKNTLRFSFTFGSNVLRIIKNGTGTALHFVYQFVTILILNHFVTKMAGTNGVIIYTVVFNLYTVSLAVFEGLSQTVQPMISVFYGEKSYLKILNTLRLAFIAVIVICGGITAVLEVYPRFVPVIFGIEDAGLITESCGAIRIFSVSMIIMTINVIIGYYLQSTERNFLSSLLVSLRCFVVFLVSVFILGKMYKLDGVWASYTVAEVVTFAVYIVIVLYERSKLKKKGIKTDAFLLEKSVHESIVCHTFSNDKDNYDEFVNTVKSSLLAMKIKNSVTDDAQEYLSLLKKCFDSSKGKYVETEIIGADKKVIIRDNLNHTPAGNVVDSLNCGSEKDYGPVLGWNRLSLK